MHVALDLLRFMRAPLVLYVSLLALILIHELGHLLAGLVCRFQLVDVRVGPVVYALKDGWKWDGRQRNFLTGHARMVASKRALDKVEWRFVLYVSGGPLANLFCGLCALPFAGEGSIHGAVASLFVFGSAILGFGNLIPLRARVGSSDGQKLFDMAFRMKQRRQHISRLTMKVKLDDVLEAFGEGRLEEGHAMAGALLHAVSELPERTKLAPVTALLEWQKQQWPIAPFPQG